MVARPADRWRIRSTLGETWTAGSYSPGFWPSLTHHDYIMTIPKRGQKMELRLPLEVSLGREATCRAVFGTWGSFPDDARASHCPFVLTSFTGWSSERCPGIGFLSRGDREIGVLRNVEAPTRPRLECRRQTGLILRCDRKVGNPFQTKQGSRPSC